MKFLDIIFTAILAVSAVDASSARVSAPKDTVTKTIQAANDESALDSNEGEHRGLVDYFDDYDYKKIYVHWTGKGTRCWDIKKVGNYYVPFATACKNRDSQYWTYTKDGQIYNKYHQKCLAYDHDYQYGYLWYDSNGNSYPVYIYLDYCDNVPEQKFLYVDGHWVSAYDGTCVDLVRDYGGFFETQVCQKCWKDQEFPVEDTWFSYFDESHCDS